jgi:ATP-dependent helicase/DNAse subunit B
MRSTTNQVLPIFVNILLSARPPLREKCLVQTRFLLGPAGSGKTFRCLDAIRVALRENPEGPPLVLLAPKQATFQLERQLLADSTLKGYTRLQILSFDRLARFILEKSSITPPRLLSEEGRVMVLRVLLMRHESELKLFRRSARRPGFASEISGQLNEFQQHQITPAKLRALAAQKELQPELRDKLQDLARIQEVFSTWLGQHGLQEAGGLLDIATDALRKTGARIIAIEQLWLDGFAEMTPQELDLLAAILPCCERATLAFCMDESGVQDADGKGSWLSIWAAVGKTYSQCRQRVDNLPGCEIEVEMLQRGSPKNRFAQNPCLQHLEEHWQIPSPISHLPTPNSQLPSAISLCACSNAESEAVFAAREILNFVRAGNRYRDCAVLVRNLESYHQPLARVFRRYGIPIFLDRRESVAHHPLAELTRSALQTVAGDWRRNDDWFAALKAGFSPVDENEIDRLENEVLARGWNGAKWREPCQINDDPALAKSLEILRRKLLPPFEDFAKRITRLGNEPDGEQLADALRKLWSDLKVEDTLERWSVEETGDLSPLPRNPSLHPTVWEQMNAWLDNLALAFKGEPMPLRDWLTVVEAGLAGLTVGVIPPVLDEVLVGAIDRARNPDLKLALMLGVNESVFPATPASPVILTNADRDELEQGGLNLGPNLRERLARERYYGYIACTRASEKLVVLFSRQDADGRALNQSPFISHLQRLFPNLEVEEIPANPDWREAEHPNELVEIITKLNFQFQEPPPRPEPQNLIRPPPHEPSPHPDPLPSHRMGAEREQPADTNCLLKARRPESGSGVQCADFPGNSHPVPLLLGGEGARSAGSGVQYWRELYDIPALKSLAEDLLHLREPDPRENLSPVLAERLFGPVLQSSVSRLEEFAACPFKFFVRAGLHAGERKLFELDARERGSFQHEVLKKFHDELAAEKKRWRDLKPSEAGDRVRAVADKLMEDFRDGLMHYTAQSAFEARAMSEALQDFVEVIVTWMRGQYEFDPVAAELDFGSDNSSAPAWEMDLGGGHKLALQGRIDRVDLCRVSSDNAWCVVMDYKSGGKKFDMILAENGIQLQLPAYLNALRHWRNPQDMFGVDHFVAAGFFYVNLRGKFDGGDTRNEVLDATDARKSAYRHNGRFSTDALPKLDKTGIGDQFSSRQKLTRAEFEALLDRVETKLQEMGRAIFTGEAKVDPYRKGSEMPCEYCDYSAVCRIDRWTHRWRALTKTI